VTILSEIKKTTENSEEEKKENIKITMKTETHKVLTSLTSEDIRQVNYGSNEADISRLLQINTSLCDEQLLQNITIDKGLNTTFTNANISLNKKRGLNSWISDAPKNFGLIARFLNNSDLNVGVFVNRTFGLKCIDLLLEYHTKELAAIQDKIKKQESVKI
jgi:hypothetical protein